MNIPTENEKLQSTLLNNEKMVLTGMFTYLDKRYEWGNLIDEDHFLSNTTKFIYEVITKNKQMGKSELAIELINDGIKKGYDAEDFLVFVDSYNMCDEDDGDSLHRIIRFKRYRDLKSKFEDINPFNPKQKEIESLLEFIEESKQNNFIYANQKSMFEIIGKEMYNKDEVDQAKFTGCKSYDDLIGGFTGGMHVLAGRPGAGKTSYALGLMDSYSRSNQDEICLFFSIEVNIRALSQKLVSKNARIDLQNIKDLSLTKKQVNDFITHAELAGENMFVIETDAISVGEIKQRIKYFENKHKKRVGLVCVDYLQIMKPNSSNHRTRTEQVTAISNELRDLSKSIPVLALAQLNREGDETKCPEPKILKDSGQIEQDASTITMLWKKDPLRQNEVSCCIVKNRFGEAFKFVEYDFNGAQSKFREKHGSASKFESTEEEMDF